VVAGRTYRVNSSISSDWVTIRRTTSSGTLVSFAVQGTNWVAPVSGTYYAHFSTNSSCGSNISCRATSVTTVSGCAPATCANTSPYGSATINSNGGAVTISNCSYAGEYSTISGAVSGQTLRFTSSVASDYITVRSGSSGGAVVAQGNTPLVFTNTYTGTLYAHWNTNSSCGTQYSCRTTTVQCTSCTPSAPDPCASISSLSCGVTSSYSLTGSTGAWNNYGGLFSTPGDEQVFSFIPTTTGVHTINLTVSSGYVDLFFKTNSCSGSSGWNYVDDVFGSASNNVTLTAGVTYYFLLDDENTTASSGSISITCPQPTPNPCSNITNIVSCGVSQNINITQGNGVWSSFGGPYSTPGRENIFTFTPTVTASYPVTITNNGSGWIDLFVKSASSGCNSSGWTYIDDISGTATNNVTLTAGTTYYFLLDDEDNLGSTGSISIGCPCFGLSVDGSYTYNGNFTISGNTTGACDNSALRAGDDLIYGINISCNGNYTFQTCGGASWDTYLYLTTQPGGGGSVLAFNDDNCGLQSGFTVALNAGQYYLVVEGYSSASNGAFTASVSGTGSAPSISGSASNVSCNGGSNGSITATVNGNGNNATATLNGSAFNGSATGLSAGTYTVSASNCWGTSTQTFTVTEPTALSASSVSGSIACNGGSTTVTVSATGGTAPYSGTGTFKVSAGTYSYTVTDANGCSSTTSITVSQPSALSVSSSSGIITCNGGSTTVTVAATGGTAPYSGTGAFTVSAGTYNYTVTDANGCTSSTSITVSEPTALVATISSTAPNATVCNGGTAPLTASVSGGLGTVNYQWQYQNNNGNWVNVSGWSGTNVSTPFTNTRFASPSATRAYRIVVTSSQNSQCTVTATQLVTVIPDPVLTITSNNISCFGANDGTATAVLTGGLPLNYGYNWYSNDGISSNNSPTGDGTLSVSGLFPAEWVINTTVSGPNYGCYAQSSVIITQPDLLETTSNSGTILCNGGSTTVTVSATGGTPPYSGTGNYTVTAGSYTYTVTDANGCTSTTSISISQPPQLIAEAGNDQIVYYGYAPMACATLNGSSVGGTGTASYEWFDDNGQSVGNTASINVCPSTTTTYTVVATDANGCSASDDVTICVIDVVCYAGNSGIAKVEMCHNGHTICINANAVAAHLAIGSTLGSCSEINGCVSKMASNIEQRDEFIEVYPNPTEGILTINTHYENDEMIEIQVYNMMGEVVLNYTLTNGQNQIDLSNFSNGIYIVKHKEDIYKVIKQ
jgi:hypothetical protein